MLCFGKCSDAKRWHENDLTQCEIIQVSTQREHAVMAEVLSVHILVQKEPENSYIVLNISVQTI